jgi:DNA-binding response OmpR family regulator
MVPQVTVLIVEDEARLRALLADALRLHGYQALPAFLKNWRNFWR